MFIPFNRPPYSGREDVHVLQAMRSAKMSGDGPFGSVEMGGMFSIFKVRKDQAPGDYKDPGWYQHPAGTVAQEWTGEVPQVTLSQTQVETAEARVELKVKKPGAHHH